MSVYYTLCFLSAAAMLIAFVNSKIGKMQTTIAITAGSMMLSLLILIAGQNDWFQLTEIATETVASINFEDFLLKGILGFLLFAGGLGIKLPPQRSEMGNHRPSIRGYPLLHLLYWIRTLRILPTYRHSVRLSLLFAIWSTNFSNRPDCGSGNSEKTRCAAPYLNSN